MRRIFFGYHKLIKKNDNIKMDFFDFLQLKFGFGTVGVGQLSVSLGVGLFLLVAHKLRV